MGSVDYLTQAGGAIFIGVLVADFLLNTGRALQAIEICEECLIFLNNEILNKEGQEADERFVNLAVYIHLLGIYTIMMKAYSFIRDYKNALKLRLQLLEINNRDCCKTVAEKSLVITLANIYKRKCKYAEAKELYEKAINITKETGDKKGEGDAYGESGTMSYHLGENNKAKEYLEKALAIRIEIGDRLGEASSYANLGTVFISLGEYGKAKEYLEKALAFTIDTGDRASVATCYGNLGTVFRSLGEYNKAKEYIEKALAIRIEIGHRAGEAADYGNLGTVFHCLGEYDKAREYHEKALAIRIETGDRQGEAVDYGNLGAAFKSLGKYDKARNYHEKALAIAIEIGDRAGEAAEYAKLGVVFESRGEFVKAREYYEKAHAIRIKIGDRKGESSDYGNIGTVFQCLGEYEKAKENHEKALAISIEIGDRAGEATDYGNLGTVFQCLGEYVKAKECNERALAIRIEIGDRAGEAACYENLGTVFRCLGEYEKAKEFYRGALAIRTEVGDKAGEAADYGNLAAVFQSLGEYLKAKEYHEKALAIVVEIGDRAGEAACYGNLGTLLTSLGEYAKAKEYHRTAITMKSEIGDTAGEATDYANLGKIFYSSGEHAMAESYLRKALSTFKDAGDADNEFQCYCGLILVKLSQGKIQEALEYLHLSIDKSEDLRNFLKDNDQFKVSFSDVHEFPYRTLSTIFCFMGNPNNSLYVLELARARALADLMATQYSVERQISTDPQSWIGIENVMKKESQCACLYISYQKQDVFLWILKTSGVIHFRRMAINENIVGAAQVGRLDDFFEKSFRSFGILPKEDCEDRSLDNVESKLKSCQKESRLAALRLIEDDDEGSQTLESSLSLGYKMLIAPVADLLEEPEIIIVPDRSLNQVSFAALCDGDGKYLSETFRIRIVPSLSTLKLIQDSPADYHSQTGALIVGDPVVGRVRYKGRVVNFKPLPCARKEAEMIGNLLGVQPLLGHHATKQAILQGINSSSLIHFAAHGNAERGEIALSPRRVSKLIPEEEDYLLTMSDISPVRLRAKLVVLSCCHSGRGQIRTEGVIGIARAFLGSGARSVMVALWAIEDRATEQLMRCFYEHLARGESASQSLHETMKWMRSNGFAKVSEWAPFMLIGDNVTFDFGK